jgi:hypothetical protein
MSMTGPTSIVQSVMNATQRNSIAVLPFQALHPQLVCRGWAAHCCSAATS